MLAVVIGLSVAAAPVGLFPRWFAVLGLMVAVSFLVLSYWPQAHK